MSEPILIRLGELDVARDAGTLRTVGVGSCVVVALYDPEARVGGLAHPVLPAPGNGRMGDRPARYVPSAIELLLDRMSDAGAEPPRTAARLAGGASMFGHLFADDGVGIGERNVEAARAALASAGVAVAGEDVGGEHGRSVELHVADGRVVVSAALHPDVHL